MKTSNIDYVRRTTNRPYSTVQIGTSPNTLINLPKRIVTESIVYIHCKIIFLNYINGKNSSHQSSS